MRKLFIYYSLSENGDTVAKYLSKKGIETRKVITKDKMPKSMFFRILTGGFLAGINHKAKLINFNNSVEEYDEIIIGSPIWNGKLSCAINSVLDELNLEDKEVKFVLYSGSGAAPKAEKLIKETYKDSEIINLKEPKKNKQELEKISL